LGLAPFGIADSSELGQTPLACRKCLIFGARTLSLKRRAIYAVGAGGPLGVRGWMLAFLLTPRQFVYCARLV